MDNILDLLVEYSKKRRYVDEPFISKAVEISIEDKDLKDYIKNVSFDIPSSVKMCCNSAVMLYDSYFRKIIVNKNELVYLRNSFKLKNAHFSEFERILSRNAFLLHIVLHEVEHANQFKKSKIDGDNFECLLLAICNHTVNEFFKRSMLEQYLIIKGYEFINPQLYRDIVLNVQIKKQYDDDHPMERMAQIYSLKDVKSMLEQIPEDISRVIELFQRLLATSYLSGYNPLAISTSPTERYLEDYKKLGISGTGAHFNEAFEIAMNKAKNGSLENRLTLGLPITKKELMQTAISLKKRI